MIYIFYLFTCLLLVIIQTTVLPAFPFFENFYDLFIPFILYLGLFRSFGEGLPIVLFLGLVMDSLSGGSFGLYLSTYFWLFIAVRWILQYLHSDSIVLMPLVIVAGVLAENFIFLLAVAISEPDFSFLPSALNTVFRQILWVIFTGPLLLLLIKNIHQTMEKWFSELSTEKSGF